MARPIKLEPCLLFGILALAGCTRSTPHLRIAVNAGLLEPFPIYLCQELGYLRDEGMEATIDSLPGGKGYEALIGGSEDVYFNSASGVLTAAGGGKHLKVFFVGQVTASAMLVVPPGKTARIRSVTDLKGATVGVAGFGTPQHALLNLILRRHGLNPGDVHVVAHGTGPPAVAAFEHGREDAGMINGSAFNVLRRRTPGLKVLVDPRTPEGTEELFGSRDYANFSLIATADWIARNPETARKLVRAMKRTVAWIRARPAEEVLARIPQHLRSAGTESDLESLRLIIAGLSEDGRMREGGPEILRQMTGVPVEKLREHGIELSQTYTNEFVEAK